MIKLTTYAEFCKQTKKHHLVPIQMQLLADTETPVSVFAKIQSQCKCPFLLESVEGGEKLARFSFIGWENSANFLASGNKWKIEILNQGWADWFIINKNMDTLSALRKLLKKVKIVKDPTISRLTAGAVGYISYDTVRLQENLPDMPDDDLQIPEIQLGFYTGIITFDNLNHNLTITITPYISEISDTKKIYEDAVRKLKKIEKYISRPISLPKFIKNNELEWKSNIDKATYKKWVKRSIDYIKAGDIFQVVLSQRFATQYNTDPFNIYRMLRIINPSPYLYYLDKGDVKLIGSSPEMLVRVEGGIVETCPIAGTRPRGSNIEEDQNLEKELITDEKERAEHIMLVDLGRNDLGRISEFGSVEVPELMNIERYSHVMHIVSTVRGKLKKNIDLVSAFYACFPAGTVSGAPKIRAMEIVDQLETIKRGVYAGAIGYFDFSGNMDWCIAIRTIIIKGKKAFIQAGAGLVADSIPEKEYQETCNKAAGMKMAVNIK
jgi:anthranilate synthase component 1